MDIIAYIIGEFLIVPVAKVICKFIRIRGHIRLILTCIVLDALSDMVEGVMCCASTPLVYFSEARVPYSVMVLPGQRLLTGVHAWRKPYPQQWRE